MEAAAKVRPAHLGAISREDIRNTLHTHFHSQASKRHAAASNSASSSSHAATSGATSNIAGGRKRVYSFVQVQKKKVSLTSKRIFGHGGLGSSASKYYILCVTVQDASQQQQQQLHYLQLLSTFQVEVRQSWDIGRLDVIENNGLTSEKKRGSFALCFEGEDAPWQWLVADNESKFAMQEFLWSLCALSVDKKKILPRLVRIDTEELSEVAIHLNLQKKYNIDVDLLDHTTSVKKSNSDSNEDPTSNNSSSDADNNKHANSNSNSLASGNAGLRLTAAENDDAAALLAGIDWSDAQLVSIEDDLKKKLRTLEDENITFLLSFEGESNNNKVSTSANSNNKSTSATSTSAANATTSVGKIISAIDTVLARVDQVQSWTNDSDEFLAQTSHNMLHFESLNNQLEVHFKNSVALQEALERMMQLVEIPREQMAILLKPLNLFPDDANSASAVAHNNSSNSNSSKHSSHESSTAEQPSQGDLRLRMQQTLATTTRIDEAIKSTKVFPASDMTAFRTRGEELSKLAKGFCDKICAALDEFLQRKTRLWLWNSRLATSAALSAANGSPSKSKITSSFARDLREASSSMRSAVEISRGGGRSLTSFESSAGGDIKEMDWSFSNELFHNDMIEYQQLLAALQSLDQRAMATLRQVYAKNLASVYNPHVQSLFRCLKAKLPRSNKHHFAKPQALQSWSFHLSSSHLGDALGASPLMQQALDHLVPLVIKEQRLVSMLFFPDDTAGDESEPEELALLMEHVFEKMLKRLTDFGEAAASRNILDALALVVLVNGQLETYRKQSEFLFNIVVSFQLQMKRLLIKFTDDQEAWINNHNTDTRMAGVLSPINKTLIMISRLEESVCGKTDDNMLASIYHRILPATLQWLERISDAKPKYRSLARLENFLFISDKLNQINSSKDLPLAQYAVQAHAKYLENLQLYVAYIWEYEFKLLVPLFGSIEELLKTLPAQEIQYHAPRQDVRKAIEAVGPTFEKSVKSMHDRMKKHFSNSAKMLPAVWKSLVEFGKNRLSLYEKVALECYQLRMEPTPQRGSEVLSKFVAS